MTDPISNPEPTPEPSPQSTPEPSPEVTAEPTPEFAAEPSPEGTAEPSPEFAAEPSPEPTPENPPDTEPVKPASRGRGPGSARIAAGLSLAGLLVVTMATVWAYRDFTPTLPASDTPTPIITPTPAEETGSQAVVATPMPTQTIVVNPEISVPGQIVYVRNGALWVQSGTIARQLTTPAPSTAASQPAFSPDGQWIYYIDTRRMGGRWFNPDEGLVSTFDLHYPVLCRIHPDGSSKQDLLTGIVKKGTLRTNYFMRQPTVDPKGAYVVVASDGPTVAADPSSQLMQLHYVTLSSRKMSKAIPVPATVPYGLSEPEYSPDGGSIAYTMEGWSGGKGNPSVWIYSNRTRTARKLAMGFRGPAWSPDGKYIAATKVSGDSLNVYVLDSSTGQVVGKITSDGESFGAVWSPDGTRLIYMQMSGALAALNMVYISNEANGMAFRIEPNLVDLSGLDSGSTASWYMPGFGPQPTPTPVPSDTASPSAS